MVEFFVASSIITIWIVLIVAPIVLIALRITAALKSKASNREKLAIILLPFSIGYYLHFSEQSRFKSVYSIILLIFVIMSVYASLFVFYTHFA